MNPITYALNMLRMHIPYDILHHVFITADNHKDHYPIALDARIRDKVIDSRVRVDCNLMGGTETFLSLQQSQIEQIDPFTAVVTFPKHLTQGRTITRVFAVGYMGGAFGNASAIAGGTFGGNFNQGSLPMSVGMAALDAQSSIPMTTTAMCNLIGENTIMVKDSMVISNMMSLHCWLEMDANMNHLQPPSYPKFAQLVLYAVQAYIYTKMMIPMNRAYIEGGRELSSFNEIVSSYAEANELYRTYLAETWAVTSLLNDPVSKSQYLRSLVGRAQ